MAYNLIDYGEDMNVHNLASYAQQTNVPNLMTYAQQPDTARTLTGWQREMEATRQAERSPLDRFIDALNIGSYPVQGFVRGFVDEEITPMQGLWRGVKAANPFGRDYTEGEYQFGETLGELGWQPKSLPGKVARGAVGLAGDILLDPLTYVTGGVSALGRGTGKKVLTRTGIEAVEELGEEAAEQIVRRVGGAFTEEQVEANVKNLIQEYNKARGIREVPDVTASLKYAPFGEKIFGDFAKKEFRIASGKRLAELGDITIAPAFNAIRETFYGSKLGEMFSTKSLMFRLSKSNPEEFYKTIKFYDYVKGLNLDIQNQKNLIRAYIDKINLKLDPSEHAEVIEALEDPSNWNKVRKYLNIIDTPQGVAERERLLKFTKHIDNSVNTMKKVYSTKRNDIMSLYGRDFSDIDTALGAISVEMRTAKDEMVRGIDDYLVRTFGTDAIEDPVLRTTLIQREEVAEGIRGLKEVYRENVDDLYRQADSLQKLRTDTQQAFMNDMNKYSVEAFEKRANTLMTEKKKMIDILNDDDAFDTYLRANFSKAEMNEAEKSLNIFELALKNNPKYNDNIKEIAKELHEQFKKIGVGEARIGKLKEEQVEAMMNRYVTHLVTPEGKKYFDSLSDKDINKSMFLTDDLGFGQEFNQYRKARKGFVVLDGKTIENPTIAQLNRYFAPALKGKNAFSENIADIYLARATKHVDLMYDHRYMTEMMDAVGSVYKGDVPEGFKAVANYGALKEDISNLAVQDMRVRGKIYRQTGNVEISFEDSLERVLERIGLRKELFDDLATPMIELRGSELNAVSKWFPQRVKVVNDVIVNRANQTRNLQLMKDNNQFLKLYDRFTHLWKLNVTTVLPSFHARNKLSNIFQNWLAVGGDAFDPYLQKQAMRAVKTRGSFDVNDVLTITKSDGTRSAIKWSEVYDLAKANGIIDEGFFATELSAREGSRGILKRVKPQFDPTDTENFMLYRRGAEIGSRIENTDRLVNFASMLSHGASVDEAVECVNHFLFDYSDLTEFEANVMKRVVPFYTWLRKNAPLQTEQMFDNPRRMALAMHVVRAPEATLDEDERMNKALIADFAKDWIQIPFKIDDKPVIWNPNVPYMDITRIPNPLHPKKAFNEILGQSNPLIKVPIELISNRHTFYDRPIYTEEDNKIVTTVEHLASQFGLHNTIQSIARKDGMDKALALINAFTGVKATSYDYEKYKWVKISELLKDYTKDAHKGKLRYYKDKEKELRRFR